MNAAEETPSELSRIARNLHELSERLRDPSLGDDEAEELARQAAELAARAGTAAEQASAERPE